MTERNKIIHAIINKSIENKPFTLMMRSKAQITIIVKFSYQLLDKYWNKKNE